RVARRRAAPPVAGAAAAALPAGRPRDVGTAALAKQTGREPDPGPDVRPRLPSHPGGASRVAVGDPAPGRSGLHAQRRGIRRRAPPPRAALASPPPPPPPHCPVP